MLKLKRTKTIVESIFSILRLFSLGNIFGEKIINRIILLNGVVCMIYVNCGIKLDVHVCKKCIGKNKNVPIFFHL